MRKHLTLTESSRRWTVAGIVFTTAAVTVLTLLHAINHDAGWPAAAVTIVVIIGFPSGSGVYVSQLRHAGEDVAADALLSGTLAAVVSLFVVWGIWAIGSFPPI
jgi:hypothetical protein